MHVVSMKTGVKFHSQLQQDLGGCGQYHAIHKISFYKNEFYGNLLIAFENYPPCTHAYGKTSRRIAKAKWQ